MICPSNLSIFGVNIYVEPLRKVFAVTMFQGPATIIVYRIFVYKQFFMSVCFSTTAKTIYRLLCRVREFGNAIL